MHTTRPAAVAGQFYPADPATLSAEINQFLGPPASAGQAPPRAIIVPHAGYPYSGQVAAEAYRCLSGHGHHYDRVVLLGPAHRVHFQGMAVPRAGFFATPLGDIPLDIREIEALAEMKAVLHSDQAHAQEHSLEVQLPFLQQALTSFHLVPIAVGDARVEDIQAVLARYWERPHTLLVISSDLSHYLDYEAAARLDSLTAEAIEQLEPERIGTAQACGRLALQALLMLARRQHAHVTRLALANSGDTGSDRDRVVGYGAWRLDT